MVYLCNGDESGLAVYLDLHALERKPQGIVLCGTVGDGHYEGEVLIELGPVAEVTFADAWLDRCELDRFFTRVERSAVEEALVEVAWGMVEGMGCEAVERRPHVYRQDQQVLPLRIGSGEANWQVA